MTQCLLILNATTAWHEIHSYFSYTTELLTFRWRDCDVENLYKCLALVTSLDIKTRYGTGYSWDPGLDQNTVWDSRNMNGIHSLSATRKAEFAKIWTRTRDWKRKWYSGKRRQKFRITGFSLKRINTETGLRDQDNHPIFPEPTLASFFSRSYISSILSFTVERSPPSKMPILLM